MLRSFLTWTFVISFFFTAFAQTSADLSLSVSTSLPAYNIGLVIPYVVKVTNAGPGTANNIKVKFPLGTQLSFQSVSLSIGTYTPATGIWEVGNLGPNSDRTMVLNCIANVGGSINVLTQITSSSLSDPDSSPNNNNGTTAIEDDEFLSVVESSQVDMALSLTTLQGNNPTVNVNDTVDYVITLANTGTAGSNTKTRCILPVGATYISHSTASGEYNVALGIWIAGSVPANSTHTLTIKAKITQAGPISYVCEVRTVNQPDFDSTPSNFLMGEDDIAEVTVNTNGGTNGLTQSDLSLTAAATPTTAEANAAASFQFVVNNAGPVKATNVQIAVTLPSGFTFSNASNAIGTYSNGIWSIPFLYSGTSALLKLNGSVGAMNNAITAFGQVQIATQSDPDSPHGNNTTGVPLEDDEAAASIAPFVDPGNGGGASDTIDLSMSVTTTATALPQYQNIILTYKVSNQSAKTASNVLVKLVQPSAGFAFVSSTSSLGEFNYWNGEWTVGTLGGNANANLTVTLFVLSTSPVAFFAQVGGATQVDFDSTPNNNSGTTPVEDDEAVLYLPFAPPAPPKKCDLALSASCNKTMVSVGDTLIYTLTLQNANGDTVAYSNSVKVNLPAGITVLSTTSGEPWTLSSSTWSPTSMSIGASKTFQITAKVATYQSNYPLFAQVQTASPVDKDSSPGNNVTNSPIEDDEASVAVATGLRRCDLALTQTCNKTSYVIGDTLVFVLTLKNSNGDTTAYGTKVKVFPSTNMTLVSFSSGFATNTRLWTSATLTKNTTKILTLKYKITGTGTASLYSQVWSSFVADKDSKPANGNTNLLLEDDEAKNTVAQNLNLQQPNENWSDVDVQIWPNPASNYVHISSNTLFDRVLVLDVQGRIVLDESQALNLLDVSAIEKGWYFLQVFKDGQLVDVQKLCIQ